ncbi:hypothetical protein T484DRAFT_1826113, partial [Baffinella frigidus]
CGRKGFSCEKHSPAGLAAVALMSPLESGARVLFNKPISLCCPCLDIFRSYSKIGRVRCPIAIMHGELDQVVPVSNGRNLYNMAKNKFQQGLWIPSAGHNDMPDAVCNHFVKQLVLSLPPPQNWKDPSSHQGRLVLEPPTAASSSSGGRSAPRS